MLNNFSRPLFTEGNEDNKENHSLRSLCSLLFNFPTPSNSLGRPGADRSQQLKQRNSMVVGFSGPVFTEGNEGNKENQ
jgi:hypothetical protein